MAQPEATCLEADAEHCHAEPARLPDGRGGSMLAFLRLMLFLSATTSDSEPRPARKCRCSTNQHSLSPTDSGLSTMQGRTITRQ